MRDNTWINADGLTVEFGTRDLVNLEAGLIHTKGNYKELHIDLHAIEDVVAYLPKSDMVPAGSVITSARILVKEAFVGGTSVEIGTTDLDNTNATTDSVIDTTLTALLVDNATIEGAGVDIDGPLSTADRFVSFTTVGTYTAGQATLIVEYI